MEFNGRPLQQNLDGIQHIQSTRICGEIAKNIIILAIIRAFFLRRGTYVATEGIELLLISGKGYLFDGGIHKFGGVLQFRADEEMRIAGGQPEGGRNPERRLETAAGDQFVNRGIFPDFLRRKFRTLSPP